MIPEGTLNAHSLEYLEQQQQTVESKSLLPPNSLQYNNQSRTMEWQYKEWKTRLDHISVLS